MTHAVLETQFDQRQFRDALGRFPTGVAIVTTVAADGERIGLTISSFNSVSLAPPLVLFSIGKRALSLPIWQAAKSYAINILSESQQNLSDRFGRPSSEKWSDLDVEILGGNPTFSEAIAVFECEAFDRVDAGDHEIFIGQVVALRQSRQAAPLPLLFYSGRYRKISDEIVGIPRYEGQFW